MLLEIFNISKNQISLVMDLQKKCYSLDLIENEDCFLHKIKIFPEGAVGALVSKSLCGYIFFHPWNLDVQVPLNNTEYQLPLISDCIYIHDLAIDVNVRKTKIGFELISKAIGYGQVHGFVNYALTAVQNSETYWERWGFTKKHTGTYGESRSTYMICKGMPKWR